MTIKNMRRPVDGVGRRRFFTIAGALALSSAWPRAFAAASSLPIADSHTHIGLANQRYAGAKTLKAEMAASGVTLLAWTIPADARWTRRTSSGIEQVRAPVAGEQATYVRMRLDVMRAKLKAMGLPYVRTAADVDAARAGEPRAVIALEGASFTEDSLDMLDQAYADGLRHLQLVHYIRNGLGDFQTERPEHNGLTELGIKVIKACNRLGILVDLAHATGPVIDRALEVASAPMIWSHSGITAAQYDWRRPSNHSRLLNIDYAKKIAQAGGAVGLWSLRSTTGNLAGYAAELMHMAEEIGPQHVMFGTDIDGVGDNGMINDLAEMRAIVDLMRERGISDDALHAISFDNYARCLKAAMAGRKG